MTNVAAKCRKPYVSNIPTNITQIAEYICRRTKIEVHYCGEQFENSGSNRQ